MKIVAFVPIKLNSKRLPNKNIKLLNGKPLLHYNLEMLLQIKEINEIYVYCSNEDILQYLPKGVNFLKRPKELDSDDTNFTHFFSSFMQKVNADIYVCSHATSPLLSANTTRKCLQSVMSGEYDSSFSARKLQSFLWIDGEKALNFDPTNIPRTQDLQPLYQESSGVYVFTKEVFKRLRQRIGLRVNIVEIPFIESIDIDTQEEFDLASLLMSKSSTPPL